MVNGEILNYLKNGVSSGTTIEVLSQNLIKEGWNKIDIDSAIFELEKSSNESDREEGVFDSSNLEVKKLEDIHSDYIAISNEVAPKKQFSLKKIIIIMGIIFTIILISVLLISTNNSAYISEALDISEGVVIEFTSKNVDIRIGDIVKTFKIRSVGEYIVVYSLGEQKGELFMKEEVNVTLEESLGNVSMRLDSINDKIPSIYIKKL